MIQGYNPGFKQAFPQQQRNVETWGRDWADKYRPGAPYELHFLTLVCYSISVTMFRQTALLALALLPFSFAQVSEDFESGWDQSAWPTYAPDCSQGGKVSLDSSTAHSGKNSIRVDGAGGYCGHIFFGTTKVPSGDIYVRTYL